MPHPITVFWRAQLGSSCVAHDDVRTTSHHDSSSRRTFSEGRTAQKGTVYLNASSRSLCCIVAIEYSLLGLRYLSTRSFIVQFWPFYKMAMEFAVFRIRFLHLRRQLQRPSGLKLRPRRRRRRRQRRRMRLRSSQLRRLRATQLTPRRSQTRGRR